MLIWGVPGLIVWAIGQVLVITSMVQRPGASRLGLRLTRAGLGLCILGWMAAVVVIALATGRGSVALVVIVVIGPPTVLLFWMATRRRVTTEDRHG